MHLHPHDPSLRAIVRTLPSFKDDHTLTECLERLMREHTHIALIRDAQGRVAGMISLEDIIEELVGEIEDEYDRLPLNIIASGSSWVAGGGVSLDRLKATTGMDLRADTSAGSVQTLSDWVAVHLGREVRGGDVVEKGSVRVVVRKIRRKKVQEAQITRSEQTQPPSREVHQSRDN
jgi:putative hemolysin